MTFKKHCASTTSYPSMDSVMIEDYLRAVWLCFLIVGLVGFFVCLWFLGFVFWRGGKEYLCFVSLFLKRHISSLVTGQHHLEHNINAAP